MAETIRIITLNTMHGRGSYFGHMIQPVLRRNTVRANLRKIADVLNAENPDVVMLQEVDFRSVLTGYFNHVQYLSDLTRLRHHFLGEHVQMGVRGLRLVSYGTALLSRYGFGSADSYVFYSRYPFLKKGFVFGTITTSRLDVPVDVISVHFVCWDLLSKRARKEQAIDLVQHIKKRGSRNPLIIGGDFNCEWDSEETLEYIAKNLGLVPCFEGSYEIKTFPSGDPKKCLDWILVSPELEVKRCYSPCEKVSDHRPVVVDIGKS